METLQLNCRFLYNKHALPGTAVAALQAEGTLCCEDIVNINKLLEWYYLNEGTNLPR